MDVLDGGHEKAHLARTEALHLHGPRSEDTQPTDLEHAAGGHEADGITGADNPFEDAHQDHRAVIGVEPAIEDQAAQRRLPLPTGRRNIRHDAFQHGFGADTILGAGQDGPGAVQADDVLELPFDPLGIGARKIDLVDDRQDLKVVIQRQIDVGHGLRFHSLGGVHHQDRSFAGSQTPGNLVGEIHVAGGIDEVQDIGFAAGGPVVEPHRTGLDGDAALAFQLHLVQKLVCPLALAQRAGVLQQPIRQRGFAVIDVRDDAEVPDAAAIHDDVLWSGR